MMKPTQFWRTLGIVLCALMFVIGVLTLPLAWLVPLGADPVPLYVKALISLFGAALCVIDFFILRKIRAIDDDSTDYRYTITCNLLFLYNTAIVLGVVVLVLLRISRVTEE